MNGTLATDYPLKISVQAVIIVSKSSVKIADDQVQVDPRLLFQRPIIACDNSQLEDSYFSTSSAHILQLFSIRHSCYDSQKSHH